MEVDNARCLTCIESYLWIWLNLWVFCLHLTVITGSWFRGIIHARTLTANCTDGTVRLVVGEDYEYYMTETNYDQAYYIDDKLSRGRVEICKGEEYHTISTDLWDKSDASVVCRELGFSPHAEKAKCYVTTNSYIELLLYITMAWNQRRLSVAHCI